MPISVITIEVLSSTGKMWLGNATRPMVAITAEMASSTGTPAATSAPNAITRMSRVTGSESVSARLRSLWTNLSIWLPTLASPNSSMRRSGCARWAAWMAASTGAMRSAAVVESPLMSNCTSAECPSFETRSEPWASVAARMFVTTGIAATRARMSRIAALNAGSETCAVEL